MENELNVLRPGSTFQCNFKNKTDGLLLLKDILDSSIKVCFFDPQYRGVLDKLNYGHEGKGRSKLRSGLAQMSEVDIVNFIIEIERVLVPSGYLFLWVDKFHLCQWKGTWLDNTSFQIVDLITWEKSRIGMGYRTRRKSEYLIIIQKPPVKAKGTWSLHNIPDVWFEKVANKNHPHAKPIELQSILIQATSVENDFILDPAAGGYSIFYACLQTKRNFIGGDIQFGHLKLTS